MGNQRFVASDGLGSPSPHCVQARPAIVALPHGTIACFSKPFPGEWARLRHGGTARSLLAFLLLPGQRQVAPLINNLPFGALPADKAWDRHWLLTEWQPSSHQGKQHMGTGLTPQIESG